MHDIGFRSLQTERERNLFKLAGYPCMLLRKPQEIYEQGMALVEELKVIEAQLTEWEDQQPLELLEKLPWWEERKKYREQKALGNVPGVTWVDALHFLECARPIGIGYTNEWNIRREVLIARARREARQEQGGR